MYLSKEAIQGWRLAAAYGMRDDIAAQLLVVACCESKAAFWKELDALGEDFVAFGEARVDLVGYPNEALEVVEGHGAPGRFGRGGLP